MESLRLFAVAGVTTPPAELIREETEPVFTCSLTLPLPPQLLIFSQGQWPQTDSDFKLDVFLDKHNIGKISQDVKCLTWDTSSLNGRNAGERLDLRVEAVGLKPPTPKAKQASNKVAKVKKTVTKRATRSSPTLAQKDETGDEDRPLNALAQKKKKEAVDGAAEISKSKTDKAADILDDSKQENVSEEDVSPAVQKGKPGKKKKEAVDGAAEISKSKTDKVADIVDDSKQEKVSEEDASPAVQKGKPGKKKNKEAVDGTVEISKSKTDKAADIVDSKQEKVSKEDASPAVQKGKPGKKKKSPTPPEAAPSSAIDKQKSSTAPVIPAPAEFKKTKQTQLNFTGTKKASPSATGVTVPKWPEADEKVSAHVMDVDEAFSDTPKQGDRVIETALDVEDKVKDTDEDLKKKVDDSRCEAQVLNESTPQINNMHSPLPQKTGKQKRLRRGDASTAEGPTPKKRGTRMRGLMDTGTPKSSRNKIKTVLGDAAFADNVVKVPETNRVVKHSDGNLTRCIDLSARTPRPSARWGHSMLLTQSRCAVLIGGQGDRQTLSKDSVWSLHTETRKWQSEEIQSEGQKPEYRMGHTATYDPTVRCIYIFGGSKNSRWFHDVHVFDLDENKWTLAKVNGKAPTRAYHTATLHRHELWIFGGVYPRPDPNPDGCSNDVHIFSPVMQSWYSPLVQGDKPIPRSGHSCTLIRDQMVMFGGWDAPFCYNDLFILDMTTVDWSQPDVKGTPPKPRSWHASCALSNSRILIHGGYDGNNALEDSFIFDLGGLSWSRLVCPNAPKPRAGHAALCLPYSHQNREEDEILVFGGGDNDGEFFSDLLSFAVPFNPVVEVE